MCLCLEAMVLLWICMVPVFFAEILRLPRYTGVPIVIYRIHRLLLVSCVLTAFGCGGENDAPETVSVTGIVTYQGNPMPNLSVGFIPEKGMLASGITDADGRFDLTTSEAGDGAIVGSYKVSINFVPEQTPEMPGFPGSENAPKSPIPTKYADISTSGLTATVDSDPAKNDFKFELND